MPGHGGRALSPPIELPIPGLSQGNAAWYIFLGWFLLAAGSVVPEKRISAPST